MDGGFNQHASSGCQSAFAEPCTHADRDAALLAQLQQRVGRSRKSHALEVGRLVFDEFFAGDATDYSSHAPNKGRSLASFATTYAAELRALQLPHSTLRNHVAAWRSWRWLPAEVRERLGLTSLVELRVFEDAGRRQKVSQRLLLLLQTGASDDDLAGACAQLVADFKRLTTRVDATAKPGRPRLPPPLKVASELQRAVTKLVMQHRAVPSLRPAERAELAARLQKVGQVVEELRRKLAGEAL